MSIYVNIYASINGEFFSALLGLVVLSYFGHIRTPYLGGMQMPWDGIDFTLTEKARRVWMIAGLLLWAMALFLCVLVSLGGQ